MKDVRIMPEHEDLEDRIYISADVEFDPEGATFSGLPPIEFEIIKKKDAKKIEKVEHVRRNKSKGELF